MILAFFTKILMFYKWLKLFCNNLYGGFLLILYFCALEIMPCFMLYQGSDATKQLFDNKILGR